MATLLLARHGETDWNAERRWQGHTDRPLNERGRAQAEALAERLDGTELEAVWSSDLRRARDTAVVVAKRQGVEPDHARPPRGGRRLMGGPEQGRGGDALPRGLRERKAGYVGWDDGERTEELSERVVRTVLRIAKEHPARPVLVVSHGGCIRAIHAAALGLDVHTYRRLRPVEPNARLSAVCVEEGRLAELCRAGEIDKLVARDQRERLAAARQPPTPAG